MENFEKIRNTMAKAAEKVYNDSCEHGFDDGDFSSLVGFIEQAETLMDLRKSTIDFFESVFENNQEE